MLLVPAVHIELSYTLNGQFFLLQLDLVCIWREFTRERAYVVGKGGREEDDLDRVCTGQHTSQARHEYKTHPVRGNPQKTHFLTLSV